MGTGDRCRCLFVDVTHPNEAETQEFHRGGQTYLSVNPCSLAYPGFPGQKGGKSPNYRMGLASCCRFPPLCEASFKWEAGH